MITVTLLYPLIATLIFTTLPPTAEPAPQSCPANQRSFCKTYDYDKCRTVSVAQTQNDNSTAGAAASANGNRYKCLCSSNKDISFLVPANHDDPNFEEPEECPSGISGLTSGMSLSTIFAYIWANFWIFYIALMATLTFSYSRWMYFRVLAVNNRQVHSYIPNVVPFFDVSREALHVPTKSA